MAEFRIRVTGPQADVLASALAERLHEQFGGEYVPRPTGTSGVGERPKADPISVAALVLAIPGAVLATVQLADRIKLADKWRALRAWAQQQLRDGQQLEISGPSLPPRALTEAEPREVIDAAIEAEQGDS